MNVQNGVVYSIMRLVMEWIDRFFIAPETSYFLFGPRGTGKSVFTQTCYPEAIRLDLLAPDVHREYVARPERLRDRLAAEPEVRQVVIDEVQRVPELLSVVHSLIESRRGLQSGSRSKCRVPCSVCRFRGSGL
jgi:uncharacterized protein